MRLGEFAEKVKETVADSIIVGKIIAEAYAAISGSEKTKKEIDKDFKKAVSKIEDALKANRALLCVYDENGKVTGSEEAMGRKTIENKDVRRYLLKVRNDLRPKTQTPETDPQKIPAEISAIIQHILEKVTHVLEIDDLGEVFGKNEQQAYLAEFEPEKLKEAEPKPPEKAEWQPRPPPTEDEFQESVERLRAQGKMRY